MVGTLASVVYFDINAYLNLQYPTYPRFLGMVLPPLILTTLSLALAYGDYTDRRFKYIEELKEKYGFSLF